VISVISKELLYPPSSSSVYRLASIATTSPVHSERISHRAKERDAVFFENPAQNPKGEKLFSEHTMSEKSNKKKHTDTPENTHKAEIDATTKTLAKLMRKPLLSLLSGAERGEDDSELDRWWTLEGVSNVSAEKLQDISDCFSALAKLHSTR
jgi:hypothetical protein